MVGEIVDEARAPAVDVWQALLAYCELLSEALYGSRVRWREW